MPRGRRPAGDPASAPGERHSGVAPRGLAPRAAKVWGQLIRPHAQRGGLTRAHEPAAIVSCEAIAAAIHQVDRVDELLELLAKVSGQLAEAGASSEAIDELVRAASRTLEPATRLRAEARLQASEWGGTIASAGKIGALFRDEKAADPMGEFLE